MTPNPAGPTLVRLDIEILVDLFVGVDLTRVSRCGLGLGSVQKGNQFLVEVQHGRQCLGENLGVLRGYRGGEAFIKKRTPLTL